ncbi:MAG: virulence protein RhuM/Fic/DOC family protein [Sulfurimonas sp.]|nr:virulence protein RhuM/Fic/DOC family protein [Sulfurimonas sp.]
MKNVEIFQGESGAIEFRGDGEHETVWATQKQVAMLFGTKVPAINKHIKNILAEDELDFSTISKMETIQVEGKREVKRTVEFYNLDMIIAIGYRVNSKLATKFRKWASSILKKYLIDGYAVNEKKLSTTKELLNNLKATIDFLASKEIEQGEEIFSLLKTYTKTLSLLEEYDKSSIEDFEGKETSYKLTYSETKDILATLKKELMKKKEATKLFANEKADELDGIIGNLYQTFGGMELYPSIEDKASHLLYFIIKDHPFNDGNKRSASFLFIYFLNKCDYLYKSNGEKKINENALTTLTLLVASSNPNEKDLLIKLIKHLIFEKEDDLI